MVASMFENIIGHTENKKFLQRLVLTDQHPHALLFYGAEGIGKACLAREFARAFLCLGQEQERPCGRCESCRLLNFVSGNLAHPDYLYVEPDQAGKLKMIKTEQMHDLIAKAAFGPVLGRRKICIINEADTLNQEAANAFLKLLEEPPSGWLFILVAAQRERLLPTILSRLIQVRFYPLTLEETTTALQQQGCTAPEAQVLARLAAGSLGTALRYRQIGALEMRDRALAYLEQFPLAAPACFLAEQDYYSRLLPENEDQLLFTQMLEYLLRDLLFIKLDLTGKLFNCDLPDKLQELAAAWPQKNLPQAVKAAGAAAFNVKRRSGFKPVLDILTFTLNDCSEGRA